MVVLPKVSEETMESVAREMDRNELALLDILKEIRKDNPQIVIVLCDLIKITSNEKAVLLSGIAVYKLLKHQMEADELAKQLLLPFKK